MSDPASWLVIESGWTVRAADGADAGTVHEVVGDREADIFDGLAIKSGTLSRPRYVPSEEVGAIEMGVVHLSLAGSELDGLSEYEEPAASERILADSSSFTERLAGGLRRMLARFRPPKAG